MRAAILAILLLSPAALGQTAPERITGTIESFAAPILNVKTAKAGTLAVTLAPEARVVANAKAALADIKPGDFLATTAMAGKDGRLEAQEVRIFAEALRGLGEGQYALTGTEKSLTNGTVSTMSAPEKGKPAVVKLSFHGAIAGPVGICSGHAPAPGQGPCTNEAEIVISPKTSVVRWELGNGRWLEPGKAVSLITLSAPDGKLKTYGVVVEHDGIKPLP
jgi:hypothetical protein